MKSIYTLHWEEIADLINSLLEKRGLSQLQFAELLKEDHTAVNKWLKVKREPGRDKINKMVEWYLFNDGEQKRIEEAMRAEVPKEEWEPMVPMIHFN